MRNTKLQTSNTRETPTPKSRGARVSYVARGDGEPLLPESISPFASFAPSRDNLGPKIIDSKRTPGSFRIYWCLLFGFWCFSES